MLVQEVGDAAVEGKATAEVVAGGEIEPGVTGIASDAKTIEVAVRADAREIGCQVEVEALKAGAQPEVAGVHGTAKKMIAGLLDGRGGDDGLEHAGVIVGIVTFQHEPVIEVGFAGPIHAAGARKIGVEVEHFMAAEADGVRRADRLVDQIAKLAGEVAGGNAETIPTDKLVDTDVERAAAFRAKRGIAGVAWIGCEGFENGGFLDALAVGNSGAGVSPEILGTAKSVNSSHARYNARAEIGVGFGASSGAEREARERLPMSVQEAGLVIATRVQATEIVGIGVLDFVLITGGGRSLAEGVGGLFKETSAIELRTQCEPVLKIQLRLPESWRKSS